MRPVVTWSGRGLLVAFACALAILPFVSASSTLAFATTFLVTLTLAMTWNVLAGYADIVTLGQHAFVGVGSYGFYAAAVLFGVSPWAAIIVAGLLSLLLATLFLVFILRLRAAYLAVGTWVVAETVMLMAGKLPAFNGGTGVSIPVWLAKAFGARPPERIETIYWIAFGLALATLAGTWVVLRRPTGIGLTAMRDNEAAAASVGVNITRARAACLFGVAPILGMVGALNALQKLHISPNASFSLVDWTVYPLFAAVIGGVGRLEGPILGAIIFFAIRGYFADLGVWHFLILGVIAIGIVVIEPGGLLGLIRRFASDPLIPVSHRAPRAVIPRASEPGTANL
jgi:branched-chain amino acid transport system permease protein